MSGHSKWSTIKRKKATVDAKRGQVFTRLAREVAVAAKEGGGDPDINFGLRLAIDRARSSNMPKENIERAIKRGTGEGSDAAAFEQATYEGYAPHGVAVIMRVVTDNRNRAVSDIRHALSGSGGSLGEGGSVAWQFTNTAYFSFPADGKEEDEIFELAVEAGADDITFDEDIFEIFGPVESFKKIIDSLRAADIKPDESELRMIPNQEISLDVDQTLQVLRVLEELDELDDIQTVYSNLHISDEALAQLEA
ncbi:MAG: YebC/PmpR family DNA-binding transcriptional regulator, partial [Chloroflexota bacterium]